MRRQRANAARIKATIVLADKSKKMLGDSHAPTYRYVSTNEKVATVDEDGKIKVNESKGTVPSDSFQAFP